MAGFTLLHAPVLVASLNVVVAPTHSLVVPVIAATEGAAITVSGVNNVAATKRTCIDIVDIYCACRNTGYNTRR